MKDPVDIAIIGMGKWGNHLLQNILKVEGLNLKYICARRKEDVETKTNASIVHDEDHILKDNSVKGVLVATQPEKHFDSACEFLKRGLKVFVEKPLTLSHKECAGLIAITKKIPSSGIMTGNKFLYSPALRALKGFIVKNGIKIESISSRWLKSCPPLRAGIFFDICYHHIYLFDYLFGRQFTKLEKFAINSKDGIAVTGVVILGYGRTACSIEATYNNHFDFFDHTIRVETDRGVFIIKEKERKISVALDSRSSSSPLSFEYSEDRERCVEEELKAYHAWLLGTGAPEFGPEEDCRIIKSLS